MEEPDKSRPEEVVQCEALIAAKCKRKRRSVVTALRMHRLVRTCDRRCRHCRVRNTGRDDFGTNMAEANLVARGYSGHGLRRHHDEFCRSQMTSRGECSDHGGHNDMHVYIAQIRHIHSVHVYTLTSSTPAPLHPQPLLSLSLVCAHTIQ